MKIINRAKMPTTDFKSLSIGDVYLFEDIPYMKISISNGVINAVSLRTGLTEVMDYKTKVVPVECELIIKNSKEFNDGTYK